MFELHVSSTAAENARQVADFIVKGSQQTVEKSGKFTIALSGGNTPSRLYALLAKPPYSERIEWDKWHVFWSDERGVTPDRPESNYRLAHETLLRHVPIPEKQIHRIRGEWMPNAGASAYEEEIASVLGGDKPTFDLIMLGVGEDGHIASLFPGSEVIHTKTRVVVATMTPDRKMHRFTFTLPLINAALNVALVANEASKADVLGRALRPRQGDSKLPVALVKPKSGTLHWFLTEEAAANLPSRGSSA